MGSLTELNWIDHVYGCVCVSVSVSVLKSEIEQKLWTEVVHWAFCRWTVALSFSQKKCDIYEMHATVSINSSEFHLSCKNVSHTDNVVEFFFI